MTFLLTRFDKGGAKSGRKKKYFLELLSREVLLDNFLNEGVFTNKLVTGKVLPDDFLRRFLALIS